MAVIKGTPGNGNTADDLTGTDASDQIAGGDGNDRIRGGLGDDFISGGAGDDGITGNQGDDLLFGGDGNDDLNGGADYDTAQYRGALSDYTIYLNARGDVIIIDSVGGRDGRDTLKNIEALKFWENGAYKTYAIADLLP